jgi:hypothetical protein
MSVTDLTPQFSHPDGPRLEDSHLDGWRAEAAAVEPTAWEKWVAAAEIAAGHSLDGDEPSGDRYSIDSAYAAWEAGAAPAEYVSSIQGP